MRGDQLSRQWRIIQSLEANPHGVTIRRLADDEECSIRTVYRDMDALQAAGFPIYSENVNGTVRYMLMEHFRKRFPYPFTMTELMSLYLSADMLKVLEGTVFYESIDSLLKKVRANLPRETRQYMDRFKTSFRMDLWPGKDFRKLREKIEKLNDACINHRTVQMRYYALHRDEETVRKVDPYKLWFMDGSIYLIGYCHNRNEFRTFLLDRINDLEVTDHRFVPRDDFSFEDYIGDTFKVFREEELVEVVVEFDKSIRQLIKEKIWHPSQEIRDNSDGSIRVTFRVAGITEIKHWLLGFGAKVKVLEPANLREEISNEAKALLDQYKVMPKKRPMAQAPIRRKEPARAQYQLKLK
ncbi:MAG: helix-turn-helix transcriptional regulator [Candidatus Hodarchaeota archaeon]